VKTWRETRRRWARGLKRDTYAQYLACCDPRVPWYAEALAAAVVAYALSPIDLIPDVIPVLGYLDDLLLVPLGLALALRLIPAPVLAECRRPPRRRERPAAELGRCGGERRRLAAAGRAGGLARRAGDRGGRVTPPPAG